MILSQTLSGLFLEGASNRPKTKKSTNREKSPQNREIPKTYSKSQNEQKGQISMEVWMSPNRETPTPFEPPRLAALEPCKHRDSEVRDAEDRDSGGRGSEAGALGSLCRNAVCHGELKTSESLAKHVQTIFLLEHCRGEKFAC